MISGLEYIPNFIDDEQAAKYISSIESGNWQHSLKRRVQQYGPIYNYTTKKLDATIESIPEWLNDDKWNQIIINEYLPGQGISKHIDSPLFGPVVASLSLLSDTIMKLGKYNEEEKEILLEKNSLLILSGEARKDWWHMIPNVKEKRYSITFRTIAN